MALHCLRLQVLRSGLHGLSRRVTRLLSEAVTSTRLRGQAPLGGNFDRGKQSRPLRCFVMLARSDPTNWRTRWSADYVTTRGRPEGRVAMAANAGGEGGQCQQLTRHAVELPALSGPSVERRVPGAVLCGAGTLPLDVGGLGLILGELLLRSFHKQTCGYAGPTTLASLQLANASSFAAVACSHRSRGWRRNHTNNSLCHPVRLAWTANQCAARAISVSNKSNRSTLDLDYEAIKRAGRSI